MEALSAGTPAPLFSLRDISGKGYTLEEALRNGPVLLAFFKESCHTSQFTLPFLERIHQAARGNHAVQIWGISQNNAADTRAFASDQGCTFPLLLDEEGFPISNLYGLTNVPSLFLVAPDGTIQVSSVDFTREDVEAVAAEFSLSSPERISVFQPGEIIPDYQAG
jgi:peroxiredoxin